MTLVRLALELDRRERGAVRGVLVGRLTFESLGIARLLASDQEAAEFLGMRGVDVLDPGDATAEGG
jgi:hypothetical protein